MKTTLNIDDTVMARLRQEAARQRKTMSELVEAALRLLFHSAQQSKKKKLRPLPKFHGGPCQIDVSNREPGPLPLAELEPHLDDVRAGDILFLYSDNARNWGTDAYWTGWSYPDADASRTLIKKGISAIGFDGPSADPVDSTTFDLHRIWLGAGRLIIENATNLDQLPERAQVVVAPLKVRDANGAPARIFALLPD